MALLVLILVLISNPLIAGDIYTNSNLSAEYIRTFSRNAAIDHADAAQYNPAGLTRLRDGLYFNISNQTFFQNDVYVRTGNNPYVSRSEYRSDNTNWFFPNAYAVYKKDRLALLGSAVMLAVGSARDWSNGLPSVDTQAVLALIPVTTDPNPANYRASSSIEGSSYFIAYNAGAAYALTDIFSISAYGRYVYSTWEQKGTIRAEYIPVAAIQNNARIHIGHQGDGFSFAAGMNATLPYGFNAAITYEHAIPVELETSIKSDDTLQAQMAAMGQTPQYRDGEKKMLELPAVIRTGLNWRRDALTMSASFTAYLTEYADMEFDAYDGEYSNTYETALSAEYQILTQLAISAGMQFTDTGAGARQSDDLNGAVGDWFAFGAGARFSPSDNSSITFGIARSALVNEIKNADSTDESLGVLGITNAHKTYYKEYIVVAFGAEYRFL